MLAFGKCICFVTCFLVLYLARSHLAFDEEFDEHNHQHHHQNQHKSPSPKDKILLKDVKTLTFLRNKRTTSRRTHSIHQLSCVGGTAGCKLFTPNVVECENIGYNDGKNNNWRCHADISDRVAFNHVEVICEGYDYPEDDYILLGSCGLEFTLDYTDPHDYHHNSYFQHMDTHEKEMHHERVSTTAKPSKQSRIDSLTSMATSFFGDVIFTLSNHLFLGVTFLVCVLLSCLVVRYVTNNGKEVIGKSSGKKQISSRISSSYGPLTSAVLTTKKAC